MSKIIKFHYTYIILALGFVLTGYFSNLIIFTSIILVHELGHFLIAKLLKFNPKKIIIYPYGGITKLDNKINVSINKELIIAISGILFQSIFYLLILIFYKNNIIREYIFQIFNDYHYSILFFNLLPIYPLDGSKIINLFLSKVLNYNLSNKLTIFISLISLILILFYKSYQINYSYIMILSIILINIYKYYSKLELIYNKFLLERYLYNIKYNNLKIIKNKNKMYKNKTHIFKQNNKYIKEDKYLHQIFDLTKKI